METQLVVNNSGGSWVEGSCFHWHEMLCGPGEERDAKLDAFRRPHNPNVENMLHKQHHLVSIRAEAEAQKNGSARTHQFPA